MADWNFGESGGESGSTGQSGGSNYGISGGQSNSASSSWQNSEASSVSQSGEYYTPQQQEWINALYPQIYKRFAETNGAPTFGHVFNDVLAGYQRPDYRGSTTFPDVTAQEIWSPSQLQQRINDFRAYNDARSLSQERQIQQQLAARGYGSNSPLTQALMTNVRGQAYAANTKGENDLRWQTAQGNAEHLLRSQLARVSRAEAMDQSEFQRQQATHRDETLLRQIAAQVYGTNLNYSGNRENVLLNALNYYNRPHPFSTSVSTSKSNAGSVSRSNSSNFSENSGSNFATNDSWGNNWSVNQSGGGGSGGGGGGVGIWSSGTGGSLDI
jgi:hypothetical protein